MWWDGWWWRGGSALLMGVCVAGCGEAERAEQRSGAGGQAGAAGAAGAAGGWTDADCIISPESAPKSSDPDLDALTKFVAASIKSLPGRSGAEVPGAAFVVYAKGELHHVTLGSTSFSRCIPVTENTRFNGEQVARVMIAIAALRLAAQGVVNLADPITEAPLDLKLSADSVAPASDLTLKDVLENRSGYRTANQAVGLDQDTCPDEVPRLADAGGQRALELFFDTYTGTLESKPGTEFTWSPLAMLLAARTLEVAAQKPFQQIVSDMQPPDSMLTYDLAEAQAGELALSVMDPYLCDALRPVDGLYLTIRDMGRLIKSLVDKGGDMVTAAEAQLLLDSDAPPVDKLGGGMVLFSVPLPGAKALHFRTRATIAVIPDLKLGYGFLGVNANAIYMEMLSEFLRLYADLEEPYDLSTHPSTWHEYEGTYDNGRGSVATVSAGQTTLSVDVDGMPFVAIPANFIYWGFETTLAKSVDADTFELTTLYPQNRILFERDETGLPVQFYDLGPLAGLYRRVP